MGQGCKSLAVGRVSSSSYSESHFDMWTTDFVTGLPLNGGLNGLMICIEKLTKLTRLIPGFVGEGALMAPKASELFFAHNM